MAKGFNKGPQRGGGQAGMMQQLQKMQQQMAEAQEKLAVETVTATAGGGRDQSRDDWRPEMSVGRNFP